MEGKDKSVVAGAICFGAMIVVGWIAIAVDVVRTLLQ